MDALKDHAIKHSTSEHYTKMQVKTGINVTADASNFTVVDWGSVISKRSFEERRIQGDIKGHYVLDARQLFAQQLLHELLASSILGH